MIKTAALFAFTLLLTACAKTSEPVDYSQFRMAVTKDLLDPDAARFRNERFSEATSDEGSQIKLYCADVNAPNAFGGMVGYQHVFYVVAAKHPLGVTAIFYEPGKVFGPFKRWSDSSEDGCFKGRVKERLR